MNNYGKTYVVLLGFSLAIAAVLRLWHLGAADVFNDEAIIAFRSVGYIDFFSSPYQTTPWEWSSVVPWWGHLSFHDHPPLVFMLQYLSFAAFGVNAVALRLPFAMAGIGTVLLMALLASRLFDKKTGIIAALLLAISGYHLWISRTGLQESILICAVVAAAYWYIRSRSHGRHWQWGVALGLAMLAKYNAVVLVPVFLLTSFFFRRDDLRTWQYWSGFAVAGVLFSPVIVYNIFLFMTYGHFDLQFSYLLGQDVAVWQELPGKIQAGSFGDRVTGLFPALYRGLLAPYALLSIGGIVYGGWRLSRHKRLEYKEIVGFSFVMLMIVFHLLLFLVIGPSKRFVAMVVPWLILVAAVAIARLRPRFQYTLMAVVIIVEVSLAVNTLFVYQSQGKQDIAYSYLRHESYNWGYRQLDDVIAKALRGSYPEITFSVAYPFLADIKNASLEKAKRNGKTPRAVLLVYDNSLYETATFWIMHRRLVYEGWPIVNEKDFVDHGFTFWTDQGIKEVYYVHALPGVRLLNAQSDSTPDDSVFVLLPPETTRTEVTTPDGRSVFGVYHWQD